MSPDRPEEPSPGSGDGSLHASGPRIAVDLMGGDHAPRAVVAGALIAATEDPTLSLTLVGPPDVAAAALRAHGATDRFRIVSATQVVTMDDDPAHAVRAKRDATVRVAARAVRDGTADAFVSVGSTGAAMAAAVFTLGRLTGVTRPALAVVVPGLGRPVVLLDVGANVDATADQLVQFALSGAAYAQVRLGLPRPRVGLLSVGSEPGKGDILRRDVHEALGEALGGSELEFVGNVESGDAVLGGRADVVVTDGFSGNVLLKAVEATFTLLTEVSRRALDARGPGLADVVAGAVSAMHPEQLGGAVLLGVRGVCVVGHGAASPRAVASCVAVAARAVRSGLMPRVEEAIARLVAQRRGDAGLEPVRP